MHKTALMTLTDHQLSRAPSGLNLCKHWLSRIFDKPSSSKIFLRLPIAPDRRHIILFLHQLGGEIMISVVNFCPSTGGLL